MEQLNVLLAATPQEATSGADQDVEPIDIGADRIERYHVPIRDRGSQGRVRDCGARRRHAAAPCVGIRRDAEALQLPVRHAHRRAIPLSVVGGRRIFRCVRPFGCRSVGSAARSRSRAAAGVRRQPSYPPTPTLPSWNTRRHTRTTCKPDRQPKKKEQKKNGCRCAGDATADRLQPLQ